MDWRVDGVSWQPRSDDYCHKGALLGYSQLRLC